MISWYSCLYGFSLDNMTSMPESLKKAEYLRILFAAAGGFAFSTWQTLLNNFAVEKAGVVVPSRQ